ncbi:hypothetical protein BD626DRAFT_78606 [Schizophyllum amplum]|uniref:Ino eighty subunit 1 n=1 Tax=Schizophyllum amplum TaxID=97359 RepID=A0A550C9L2_9AGAR|nr:hypothetical protein BD626DRAFT_78606 [Auriculariopsis ampla]
MTEVIHIEPAGLGSRLEAIPPVGYLTRKALPIKRNDAEPLTREDIQYDLLYHIFNDNTQVFTNQVPGKYDKVTFRQLYVNALYHSSKCSKVLKDKMLDTPEFAVEFAKIALLTNVGRINTTMAFFPEMKTALRTYHPVPSLQKTDGNAQDAPRIKNCLKSALLASEVKKAPPSNPPEIIARYCSGMRPPTSVVNLIFVLSTHAALSQTMSRTHFDGNINFLDLFIPTNLSSPDRARAFLFIMFYYLEAPTGALKNPFGDELSEQDPAKAPRMHVLSPSEARRENVDLPEELEWGHKMSAQRNIFLQKLVSTDTRTRKQRLTPTSFPEHLNQDRLREGRAMETRHGSTMMARSCITCREALNQSVLRLGPYRRWMMTRASWSNQFMTSPPRLPQSHRPFLLLRPSHGRRTDFIGNWRKF